MSEGMAQASEIATHAGPDLRLEPDYYDFLSIKQVEEITGLKKTAIYERIAAGTFPKQRSLGGVASRWWRGEVRAWCRSCPAVD